MSVSQPTHMRRIGVSQRVHNETSYEERRDCLDQRWAPLLLSMDWAPIPLFNIGEKDVSNYLEALGLDAVLLSGGNSLSSLDPAASDAAPERDAFESYLVEFALKHKLPILAICRGMQFLNTFFGGRLSPVAGHVAKDHDIETVDNRYVLPKRVNSYHGWGISDGDLSPALIPLAQDDDENIEAFTSDEYPLLGLMWHPERDTPFNPINVNLMKSFLT